MADAAKKLQLEFHVTKAGDSSGESLGPWTIEEIAKLLASNELAVTDFVYDDEREDWITLLECQALKAHLGKAKPKAPPPKMKAAPTESKAVPQVEEPVKAQSVVKEEPVQVAPATPVAEATPKATPSADADAQWFVQKGPNRYGPFTYLGLIRALQEKTVYEFDFVAKAGSEQWTRIAEHEMFQPEKIRDLRKKASLEGEVFLRREHARLSYDSEVIVHDDRSVWMGRSYEASLGGSGLTIDNSTLQPGQVVRLHFASTKELPAFNALGEIVGKQFSKEVRDQESPVKYAVRFLKIDGSAQESVKTFFRA